MFKANIWAELMVGVCSQRISCSSSDCPDEREQKFPFSIHHLQLLRADPWGSPWLPLKSQFWGFPPGNQILTLHSWSSRLGAPGGKSLREIPWERLPKLGIFWAGRPKGQGEKTASGASSERNFPDKTTEVFTKSFSNPEGTKFPLHKRINRNKTRWLCQKSGGTLCPTFSSFNHLFLAGDLAKAQPEAVIYLFHPIKAGYCSLW